MTTEISDELLERLKKNHLEAIEMKKGEDLKRIVEMKKVEVSPGIQSYIEEKRSGRLTGKKI